MKTRFRPSDWLIVSGGLLLFIASVLPWWEVSWADLRATFDAFDFTGTGVVPLVLFLAVTVLLVIIKTDSLSLPDWLVHPVLIAVMIGFGSVLVGVRFFWHGFDDSQGVSRGVGLYLAGAAVVIAIGGCVLAFREERLEDAALEDEDEEDEDEDDEEDAFDEADEAGEYGYVDEEEDDLIRRFNTSMPSGEVPVTPRHDTPRTRTPSEGLPPRRRRATREDAPPPSRRHRRQSGPSQP